MTGVQTCALPISHKGLAYNYGIQNHPYSPKYQGGFAMYGYLQNVKTNVSNARRNNPKVIKSLKSKWFFIGITPILLSNEANPPCNTVASVCNHTTANISFQYFYIQFLKNPWLPIQNMLYYYHKNNRPQGVGTIWINKTTHPLAKVSGWFCYVCLLTKRKNECKQCQKK